MGGCAHVPTDAQMVRLEEIGARDAKLGAHLEELVDVLVDQELRQGRPGGEVRRSSGARGRRTGKTADARTGRVGRWWMRTAASGLNFCSRRQSASPSRRKHANSGSVDDGCSAGSVLGSTPDRKTHARASCQGIISIAAMDRQSGRVGAELRHKPAQRAVSRASLSQRTKLAA